MLSRGVIEKSKKSGLTLIEVMIAMVIGLFIIGLVSNVLIEIKNVAVRQSDRMALMEKSNRLSALFRSQIHHAGFIGCARLTSGFSLGPVGKYHITDNNRLIGTDNEIMIRYMGFNTKSLVRDMSDREMLVLSTAVNIHPGDKWAISHCKHAEWFDVLSVKRQQGVLTVTCKQPLSALYDHTSEVGELHINRFYVRSIKNKTMLMMHDINGRQTVMIEGVSGLSFKYTVEELGHYRERGASDIHDWSNVRGVWMTAMIQSGRVRKLWQSYYVIQ